MGKIALPSKRTALKLLRKYHIKISIRHHSIEVANTAQELMAKIKNIEKLKINRDLVIIGALLHDIGRSRTHTLKHAYLGGKIVKSLGYSKKLARICETHVLGGLDKKDAEKANLPSKNFLPETIEEKLVCLADKMTMGKNRVTIEERFKYWFSKYGKSELLLESKNRVEKIEQEIKTLMK
ncbi:MAG: HDIG domain-containing metalloprotein [Promethearchaeia archaeon]